MNQVTAWNSNILNIYSQFGKHQDYHRLLEEILRLALERTSSDAISLFLTHDQENLHLKTSLGNPTHQKKVKKSLLLSSTATNWKDTFSASLQENTSLNIRERTFPDFWHEFYQFHIETMILFPIREEGAVIGVIQLVSEEDFTSNELESYRDALESFSVQTRFCLNLMKNKDENLAQLNSFIQVFTTAIDQMSPFNGNHTSNMAIYGEKFLNWLDKEEKNIRFSDKDKAQFLMSIHLHDIGKLTTPPEILNKETRLGWKLSLVEARIEKMLLYFQLQEENHHLSQGDLVKKEEKIAIALETIKHANRQHHLEESIISDLEAYHTTDYLGHSERIGTLLTPEELFTLTMQNTNLTPDERELMKMHVVFTKKLLEKIKFTADYHNVLDWASDHHESLNGTGYPLGKQSDQIPTAVRLLTILDRFEAIVAKDRPYKKFQEDTSPEEAIQLLREGVTRGELDHEIVELFSESKVWL